MLIALWNDFFTRFTDRLNAVNPADLLAVWDKEEARTQIYTQVLRDVSEGMGLTFRREHSRIDYMLGNAHLAVDRTALAFVPSIAIESENQAMGAHEEVNFLHAVTAPVKVLITCALWTRSGSRQWSPERLLEHWRAIRQVHCAAAPARPDDVFGIIVGEKALDGRSVRFFLHMLSDLPAPPSREPFATLACRPS